MREGHPRFGDDLRRAAGGFFYYAGHGMQVKGRNHLCSGQERRQTRGEIEDPSGKRRLVLQNGRGQEPDEYRGARRLPQQPFSCSFRSNAQGLRQMDAPSGTIVAFATAPGSVAADGRQPISPYPALVANIRQPGLKIEDVFKRVRVSVKARLTGATGTVGRTPRLKAIFVLGTASRVRRRPPICHRRRSPPSRRRKAGTPRPSSPLFPRRPHPDPTEPTSVWSSPDSQGLLPMASPDYEEADARG